MYVQRNIDARSRIAVAAEKLKVITYLFVCARERGYVRECPGSWPRACSLVYPACNAYAPYCVAICGLSGSTKFFGIISQTARLSGKKIIEHNSVLIFSTFLILRRIQPDTDINVKTSSCKVPVILVEF